MKTLTAAALSLSMLAALAPVSAHAQAGPPPLPPMPAAPAGAQYYYNDNGKQAGPFSADEIKQKMAAGIIGPDTLVWKSGTPSWVAAKTLPELASGGGGGGAAPVAEAGCKSSTILISDDYSATDPDDTLTPETGKVKYKAFPGEVRTYTYTKALSGDAEICVTVQIPHQFDNPENVFGGVVFGGNEAGDYDVFLISPTGNASVGRSANQKVEWPIAWRKAASLNPAPGSKNRLRVRLQGGTATFFINNQQFASFNGSFPDGAGKIGIFVVSEATRRDSWKFANFRATALQ
jgi:hypothetical protein